MCSTQPTARATGLRGCYSVTALLFLIFWRFDCSLQHSLLGLVRSWQGLSWDSVGLIQGRLEVTMKLLGELAPGTAREHHSWGANSGDEED